MERPPKIEVKESPEYHLNIIIHRHGPKVGTEGPLSEHGKETTREYFESAYDGITMEETEGIQIEHSPIHRTEQSALLYSKAIEHTGSGKIGSVAEDERLSEGGIAEDKEVLNQLIENYGRGGKWIHGWLDMEERPSPRVKTGTEAVSDFASWLLEKISRAKEKGGKQEVDAFSHGPVMLAFLIKLQEQTEENILPKDWENQDVFSTLLNYLSDLRIWTDSCTPEELTIEFNKKQHSIPIKTIESL